MHMMHLVVLRWMHVVAIICVICMYAGGPTPEANVLNNQTRPKSR